MKTIGLKTAGGFDAEGNAVINVSDPTNAQDAATKAFVDAVKTGALGVVVHGATAGTARPTGYGVIFWIGSVEPTNATNNDAWFDTTA